MQHSDFEFPTEGITGGAVVLGREELASEIAAALQRGDHESAGSSLREAADRFPDDVLFLRLAGRQRRQAERFTRVFSLLKEAGSAMAEDEFVRALGAFREAANLSQGFADLAEATFEAALKEAGQLGDRNWRIGRALLEEASHLSSRLTVPAHLWRQVEAAEREETISNVLGETALPKPAELERARARLERTLQKYPGASGLETRLKSIESTIEEKRKWEARRKRLKKLADLRDALGREEDPAQALKYVALSEALATDYGAEPEFSGIVEDIKSQVTSSEKAAASLKADRIEECLEECAWVLSRLRHHRLFLKLKQEAEERELTLVDEYSSVAAGIQDLLAAGQIAEAEKRCAEASARFPQFAGLRELSAEIELRRAEQDHRLQHQMESARRLVESAERSLLSHQFRAAEQSFGNALKLLAEDEKLPGHIKAMLHGYARDMVGVNAGYAEEALQIAGRLLPGEAAPADLTETLRQKREQAAAAERPDKTDENVAAFDRKQTREPIFLKALPVAAALVLSAGVAFWFSHRQPSSAPSPGILANSTVEAPVAPTPEPIPIPPTATSQPPAPAKTKPQPSVKATAPLSDARALPLTSGGPAKASEGVTAGPVAEPAANDLESGVLARARDAEQSDWSSADRNSRASLEDFLKRYPDGAYAAAAAGALADLERRIRAADTQRAEEAANRETSAVLSVISRFADAWNSKDLDSILAIQKNLNKRTVKAELSQVKEIVMRISPASPPKIEGSQAVVLCRRQASQVFSDGTRKQIPESVVSYVLAKHDGSWIIEGTR